MTLFQPIRFVQLLMLVLMPLLVTVSADAIASDPSPNFVSSIFCKKYGCTRVTRTAKEWFDSTIKEKPYFIDHYKSSTGFEFSVAIDATETRFIRVGTFFTKSFYNNAANQQMLNSFLETFSIPRIQLDCMSNKVNNVLSSSYSISFYCGSLPTVKPEYLDLTLVYELRKPPSSGR